MKKKDKKLPLPMELKQKMEKAELSVNFQNEFPAEYATFTAELKKKLTSKPYRPVQKAAKRKNPDLNIPWNLTISEKETEKKRKKLSPTIPTLIRAVHGHGNTFKDHNGYYQPPLFTKAKVEKTFAIYLPIQKFQQLKKRLNSQQKRKKLGRAKSIKQNRKGNMFGKHG